MREKRLQLRLRYRKCIIQLRVDGRSRESRSGLKRVERLRRAALQRQTEHPEGKKLRRHVAGKAPFSLRPVPTLPDVTQHRVQHAVKKRPLRRFAVCLRFCQKGYRRVEKLSVRSGFFRLAPVKEAERQRQYRKPFIEPAAQNLVPLLPVRHTPASFPHFLQYSMNGFRTKEKTSEFARKTDDAARTVRFGSNLRQNARRLEKQHEHHDGVADVVHAVQQLAAMDSRTEIHDVSVAKIAVMKKRAPTNVPALPRFTSFLT